MIKQARDTPCGQFPYAITGNHQWTWRLGAQYSPSRHRLGAAQDLAHFVRVQIIIAGLANELARILAVEDGFCSLEHRGRRRRIGQQIEHVGALIALAGTKDSSAAHEWASRASRRRVIANKSAQPPGLRRRSTND